MAEHDFVINFRVNNQQAQQAKQEEVQAYKQVEGAAVQASKAATQASDAEAKARRQKISEILSAQEVAVKAREELIARENKRAIQAAADQADAHKQGEKARLDAIRATAEAQKKASDDLKRQAREASQAQKDAARQAADAQKQAAQQAKDAARQAAAAQKQAAQETSKWASAGMGVVSSMTSIIGAMGGLTSVTAVVSALADQWQAVKAEQAEAVRGATDYRELLREIASLKGMPNVNTETIRQEFDFRRKTGMAAGDATKLQIGARGMAASVIDEPGFPGRISQGEFDTALVSAGKLQALKNVDATQMGKLAGAVTMYGDAGADSRMSADEIKEQLVSLFKVGDIGTFDDAGQYASALTKAAPSVQAGDFSSLGQLGGFLSAMSMTGPGEVNTKLDQLTRMSKGSIKDVSKPPGASMSPSEYLSSLKVTDQQDVPTVLETMAKDVDAASAKAAANGQKLSIDSFLRERGYGSIQDIGAFKDFYSSRYKYNKRFAPMANAIPSTQEADAYLGAGLGTPGQVQQAANLARDEAKFAMGGGPQEIVNAYKEKIFEESKAIDADKWWFEKNFTGEFKDNVAHMTAGPRLSGMAFEDIRRRGIAMGKPWQPSTVEGTDGAVMIDPIADFMKAPTGSQQEASNMFELLKQVMPGATTTGSAQQQQVMEQTYDRMKSMDESLKVIRDNVKQPKVLAVAPKPQVLGLAP